jgi:hypothetical protein
LVARLTSLLDYLLYPSLDQPHDDASFLWSLLDLLHVEQQSNFDLGVVLP